MKIKNSTQKKELATAAVQKKATSQNSSIVALERYAIIQTGGKQYFAVEGKTLAIEKLPGLPGEDVTFDEVLLCRSNVNSCEIGQPFLNTPVKATIVKHIRGPKIIAYKFKRRKKQRTKKGHRQSYTIVRFTAIS